MRTPISATLASSLPLALLTCFVEAPETLRFTLEVDGEQLASLPVALAEMRLPPTLADVTTAHGVRDVRVPEHARAQLAETVRRACPREPVWLRLGSPAGQLSAVPWEHLLQRALGVPLLRLPSALFEPAMSSPVLRIAVCAPTGGDPQALRHLRRVVEQTRETKPGATRIDLFTDARDALEEAAPEGVTVHVAEGSTRKPPAESSAVDERSAGIPGQVENRWLHFMLERLEGGCDVVHFVAPGRLSSSYGAVELTWPEPLGGDCTSALVAEGELTSFLTRLGAYGVGFTIASRTAWPAGIRVLAHCMSETLTGPVLVDSPHHDGGAREELGRAYALLYGPDPPLLPPSCAACSLYVTPLRVRTGEARALHEETEGVLGSMDEQLRAWTLKDALEATPEAPAWAGANQRMLERYAADLLGSEEEPSARREAADRGSADALSYVSDLLAQHLRSDGEPGAS